MEEKKKKSHSFALPLLAAGGAAAAVSHNRRRQPSHLPSSEKQSKVIPPFSAGTAALSFFQSNQWNIWFDERERLDCSLGRLAPQIQIKSILLFPFSKRKEDWLIDLNFAAGIKVSWINQKFIHWFHKNKLKFIFISSIPFTFALFTSTFIPLYCYNTFSFLPFQSNKLNEMKAIQKKFISFCVAGMEWELIDWLTASSIEELHSSYSGMNGYMLRPQSIHSTLSSIPVQFPSSFNKSNSSAPLVFSF